MLNLAFQPQGMCRSFEGQIQNGRENAKISTKANENAGRNGKIVEN